jgi:hypothetical protein
MSVTKTSSGVTGALAKDGRLTRGGMLAVGGFGLLLLLIVAAEWRALTAAAFGITTAGKVVEVTDGTSDQQDYDVRVEFAAAGGPQVITRHLRLVRGNLSRPRLRAGDEVPVAYRPAAPADGVLVHPHENYAAAPWTSLAGIGLLVVAWYWRPRAGAGQLFRAAGRAEALPYD